MRLNLSQNSNRRSNKNRQLILKLILGLFALQSVASAQTAGTRDVISTGSNSARARVNSQPTGQILLDRSAPIVKEPSGLELGNPPEVTQPSSQTGRARQVSSLQQSLPAAAVPTTQPEYTTGSPYHLRSVNSKSKEPEPLRVTPVSSMTSVEPANDALETKAPAPKVSRKPVPQPANSALPSVQPSNPITKNSANENSTNATVPQIGSALTTESELPEVHRFDPPALAPLKTQQSVSVPTELSLPSANELKSQANRTLEGMEDIQSLNSTLPPALPSLPGSVSPQFGSPTLTRQPELSKPTQTPLTPTAPRSTGVERIRMQSPRLSVVLTGPPELSVGKVQTYTVNVHNEDKVALGGIILRLDLPPGIVVQPLKATHGAAEIERAADGTTMLTWSFEKLDGNGIADLPLNVIAQVSRNFAVAMEWTILPMASSAGIEVLTPQLELALEGPSEVNFSEANVYRLHIRNRGTADAAGVAVKLSAEHFGSSATQIETIPAGSQQTVDVELVFNEPGNITISAEANAVGNVSSAAQVGVRVRQSVLEAALEAPEMVYHSSPTPYVLRVRNMGDAAAKTGKAVITLPADCTPISLPAEAVVQNGSIVWELNNLKPGQINELPFKLSFAREGDNRVSVHCSSNSGAPVQCAAVTMVKAVSDLKLYVIDPVAPAPVGGEVEYELKLVNRGSKAAEQVSVVGLFSKDIEPTRAEGQRSQILTGQVRFQPISRIEPGQTVVLRVFAQAASAGTHRFRAEVRTAEADVKLVQEQSTEYMESVRRTANSPSSFVR